MDVREVKRLFEAVRDDNIAEFERCMANTQCGTIRFGRFPVLSTLYLYNSKKILSQYEEQFLKYNSWTELEEPVGLAAAFGKKAGKCLRLYYEETVTPAEMLLILDKTAKLKRVYPSTRLPAAAKQRLKEIYKIKYALKVEFEGENIVIDRRPLTRGERKRLLIACVSAVLCVAVVVGTPFVVNAFIPFINANKPSSPTGVVYTVSSSAEIDFASSNIYRLASDVTVAAGAAEMNCELIGEGKTITVTGTEPLFSALTGKLSEVTIATSAPIVERLEGTIAGVTIDTDGSGYLIGSAAADAVIEDVTVNVHTSATVQSGHSFFIKDNLGTVKNVRLNVSGSLNIVWDGQESDANSDTPVVGGLVANNNAVAEGETAASGKIQGCVATYTDFTLTGEAKANVAFGGIVGNNGAYVTDCRTEGEIKGNVVDLAGICVTNKYLLSGCENAADIYQNTADDGWNPISSGIVINNSYVVEKCINNGAVTAVSRSVSDKHQVSAAGIANRCYSNAVNVTPYIIDSINGGDVTAQSADGEAYAGGICIAQSGPVRNCLNAGAIVSRAEGEAAVAGGISAMSYAYVVYSVSAADIVCEGDEVFLGGITALTRAEINTCHASGKIEGKGKQCYVGGIFGKSDHYNGIARSCVSAAELDCAATGDACIGGIGGYMEENTYQQLIFLVEMGGLCERCYFIGTLPTTDAVKHIGGILGACGKTIAANDSQQTVLSENAYADASAGIKTVGSLVTKGQGSLEFVEGADFGAYKKTVAEIKNNASYKSIINTLSELLKQAGNYENSAEKNDLI